MDADTDAWLNDARPIQRVGVYSDAPVDDRSWPATIPAIAQFLSVARTGGWEFGPGVTFLVGENGSGKSTLIEAIAEAYGLPAEGGTRNGGAETRRTESPLGDWLRLERSPRAPRWGFFLRAETMHGYYSYLDDLPGEAPSLHPMSHGESFNALLDDKLDHPRYRTGLACLDEPEAALSFSSTLRWLASLDRMRARGTQVICATHSPVLAALPGAHDPRARRVGHPRGGVGRPRPRAAASGVPRLAAALPPAPARLAGAVGACRNRANRSQSVDDRDHTHRSQPILRSRPRRTQGTRSAGSLTGSRQTKARQS